MGDNKKTRIKLEGWLEHIAIHERKITEELAKPEPNMGLVVHWESEIRAAMKMVVRLQKRLPGGKK